jgi:hypothetical protein
VKLYHATSGKWARRYRQIASILSPVRGFTMEQAAMAWVMKVWRSVILEFEAPNAHKLPDHTTGLVRHTGMMVT